MPTQSIQLVTLSGLVETKPVLDVALKILRSYVVQFQAVVLLRLSVVVLFDYRVLSSMQKLTKADQLFAISVKRRHTRARTRGDEDEMEERFYSIYANVTQGSSLEFTKEQPASVHPLPAMAPPNRGSRRNTHHRRQVLCGIHLRNKRYCAVNSLLSPTPFMLQWSRGCNGRRRMPPLC